MIFWQWILKVVVLIIISAVPLIILIYYRKIRFRRRFEFEREYVWRKEKEREFLQRERERIERHEPDKKTIAEIIEEKKKRFSNVTSVSFHFVDKNEIENFYNDTFREPTLESLVSEITGEISGEVKGSLPKILESKIGGRDVSKWISTIKLPETSLSGMFIKYQKEAIQRGEVTLGLEELDIELNELQKFDLNVENLKKDFGFDIEPRTLENHRSKLRQKAAEKTLTKLEKATGLVLIDSKFLISLKEKTYELSLTHPVNKFLPPNGKEIKILFSLPVESIESRYAGNYINSVGTMIPLRAFGKVWRPIDRNADVWELQITPFAIY